MNKIVSLKYYYFSQIYCINLESDAERRECMKEEFEKNFNVDIPVNFISAQRPHPQWQATNYSFPGEIGVTMSHLKALITHSCTQLRGSSAPGHALIFEDDVKFIENAPTVLLSTIKQIDNDWDIIYLGGTPKSPMKRMSENVLKVEKFTSAMAYAINRSTISNFINFALDRITLPFPHACFDNILNDYILLSQKGYACYPPIAWDIPGWSTLRQGHRNYRDVLRAGWEENTPNEKI